MLSNNISFYYPGTKDWLKTTIDFSDEFNGMADIFSAIFQRCTPEEQCQFRLVSKSWAAIMPIAQELSADPAPTPFAFVNDFFKKAGIPLEMDQNSLSITPLQPFRKEIWSREFKFEELARVMGQINEEKTNSEGSNHRTVFLLKLFFPHLNPREQEAYETAIEQSTFNILSAVAARSVIFEYQRIAMPFFLNYLSSQKNEITVANFCTHNDNKNFSAQNLRALLLLLKEFKNINKLNFEKTPFGKENAKILLEIIKAVPNLRTIRLTEKYMEKGVKEILAVEASKCSCKITLVNQSFCPVSTDIGTLPFISRTWTYFN